MPDEQSCANLLFLFFSPSRPSPLLHIRTHTQCSGPVATRPARPSRPWRNHNQSGPLPHQMPSPRPQDGGRSTPQPGILQPPQQHNPQLRKSSSPATRGLPPALVLIWPNCQHQLFYSDVRTKPSPSFNTASRNNVEPLADKSADMDESYVPLYRPLHPLPIDLAPGGKIMLTVRTGSSARLEERFSTR